MEARENPKSGEIPITLFEDAYNALATKYKTAFDLRIVEWKLPRHQTIDEKIPMRGDFLFVGMTPMHINGFPYEGNSIIGLTKSGVRDELIIHAYNRELDPLWTREGYLSLSRTSFRKTDYRLSVLKVELDITSLLDTGREVTEREEPKISRYTVESEESKKQILEDLIKFIPLWTPVRLHPIKL